MHRHCPLQDEALQNETVRSLRDAPFTKIRMGLFPKDFMFNANEPDLFPLVRDGKSGWDTTRFDVEYFRRLEHRIEQLDGLGIQADLILFHPYDRWGFATMNAAADDRYVSYVVRRLSAFPNVWWSMANEYDLLTTKRRADWDRLAGLVQANDPVGHPLSIHNWVELFDYTADWATHCSIQRGDYAIGEEIARWRRRWGKPVIVDEFGYEGDIDQGWGNATSEEVVRKFWAGAVRGGYLTHGETYFSDDDVLWWSKGGKCFRPHPRLRAGRAPARAERRHGTHRAEHPATQRPLPPEDAACSGPVDRANCRTARLRLDDIRPAPDRNCRSCIRLHAGSANLLARLTADRGFQQPPRPRNGRFRRYADDERRRGGYGPRLSRRDQDEQRYRPTARDNSAM